MCCFARPGEVILTYPSDESSFQRKRSQAAKQLLESSRDARGRALKIHLLELPKPQKISVYRYSLFIFSIYEKIFLILKKIRKMKLCLVLGNLIVFYQPLI